MQVRSIGVFYGSTTGNTEEAADEITRVLCSQSEATVRVISVSGTDPSKLFEFDALVLGCPTWDDGKPVTFQDAQGILAVEFRARGARLIGSWPTEGYTFNASRGVENGQFFGLALDTDDAWSLTRSRITTWSTQLLNELDCLP
jgi:flavodoxin I